MILIDYSAICHAAFYASGSKIDEDMLRHMILNSIRMYNLKYRSEYGQLVIAVDSSSWRRDVFANYKKGRSTAKEESKVDWQAYYEIVNQLSRDIRDNFPYPVIHIKGAEADDIIATLTARIIVADVPFGTTPERVMIISADHDFIQLHCERVRQFSPGTKKAVSHKNPKEYLTEHIIRGCSGDGVPNILSDDDAICNPDKRQVPVRKKFIEDVKELLNRKDTAGLEKLIDREKLFRNVTCIDFRSIPKNISEAINAEFERQRLNYSLKPSKILTFLIEKRCRNLIECIEDFNNQAT